MARSKEVQLTPDASAKLQEWLAIKPTKMQIEEKEFELRQAILSNAGFNTKKLEGSETITIGNGYKLKATKQQYYALSNEQGETVTLLNAVNTVRPDLAAALVKWKADVSREAYRELVEYLEGKDDPQSLEIKRLLSNALSIKPGSPQLEFIAPETTETK